MPQVWAWGTKRLEKLAQWVKKAAVILPFEEKLLRDHGIDATFVGHPLLDRAAGAPDRAASRGQLGLPADAPVLALFPGSRAQEIARHLDPFVATATLLRKENPELRVVVSAAPHVVIDTRRCPFPIVRDSSFAILRAADAALCKSGTTTLEASVAGKIASGLETTSSDLLASLALMELLSETQKSGGPDRRPYRRCGSPMRARLGNGVPRD